MSSITNNVKLKYEYNEEEYEEKFSCDLQRDLQRDLQHDPVKPTVSIDKSGSPNDVRIGDTITYYLVISVGDGDDVFGSYLLEDIIDSSTDFIDGTLKLNGEVMESQDLTNIEIELQPNTVYQFEYQCIRTRL